MVTAIVFGIFAWSNPDLKANNGVHCWVEQGYEPVPIGQNHTEDAVDGTVIMMNVIKAQFWVSTFLVISLLVTFVPEISISFL